LRAGPPGPLSDMDALPEIAMEMKKEKTSSLVWLGLAILICAESLRRLSLGTFRDPGAGFLPFLSGIVLGGLALTHFLQSSLRKSKANRGSVAVPERWRDLLVVYASLLAYVFLLEPLGFLIATFLLLLVLFRTAESRPWGFILGASAVTSLITFLVFDVFLKCQLPRGILSF
jgi:putative tricarboxylic transport membrane protein